MLPQDKRGVSEVIGYVILISLAVIISVAVFVWFKSYVPTDSLKCPDGVSLIIESAKLSESSMEIIISNNGLFNVDGYILRGKSDPSLKISDKSLSEYVSTGATQDGLAVRFSEPLIPDGEITQSFDLSFLGNIYSIEVVPVVYENSGNQEKMITCGNPVEEIVRQ